MVDIATFQRHVPRLGRHAYSKFVAEFFNTGSSNRFDRFDPLPDAGEDVFVWPYKDSYGGSVHNVYLIHFPPIELFHPDKKVAIDDPVLVGKLTNIRGMYKGRKGAWGFVAPSIREVDALQGIGFITNIVNVEREAYDRTLFPAYADLLKSCQLTQPALFLGSCDSFLDLNQANALSAFENFVTSHADGLAVTLNAEGPRAIHFVSESSLGIPKSIDPSPYEPAFLTHAISNRNVLQEFDQLLSSSALESQLEHFLAANYRLLFGFAYDRIETQLWLHCPDLDLQAKARRLDVFLRNSVTNDWELFEIKRTVPLVRSSADVPSITAELVSAIHQIKNYARLLAQDEVKRRLAKQGIEYFEPRLTVVIGRTPSIPLDQWRWLKTTNQFNANIVTYDELRHELVLRLEDRFQLLQNVQPK